MQDFSADNLTEAVVQAYTEKVTDARLQQIFASLIRHLHAFAKDVKLTEAEWLAGIKFLTATGHMSDDSRQEFILLSDVLGLSMLVDAINHPRTGFGTENTVLGPFYVPNAPTLPQGASIIRGTGTGSRVVVKGLVTDRSGAPVPAAVLEVWQAAENGLYHMQDEKAPEWNLCGVFRTDSDGQFAFVTVAPTPYPIPTDGPVGQLLLTAKRDPTRPAHIHFRIKAEGYEQLTTHIFVRGDPYLDSDPVFATKNSLIADVMQSRDEAVARQLHLEIPFNMIEWNFGLRPIE
jgi:catechol 1,2-dioxygenase